MRASVIFTTSLFRTIFGRQLWSTQRNSYSSALSIFEDSPDRLTCNKDPRDNDEDAKLLRVSIIGVPNAGKSTLVNRIMNYDVCPVSKKSHTTRRSQKVMYLEGNTQVVFMDTPGLVNSKEAKKFSFIKDFVLGPERAIRGADLLAVIHDVRNPALRNKLDHRILNVLKKFPEKHTILVLNKVDTIGSKRRLLQTVQLLTNERVGNKKIPFRQRKQEQPLNTSEILNRAKKRMETVEESDTDNQDESVDGPFLLSRTEASQRNAAGLRTYNEEREEPVGWSNFQEVFMVSALEGDGVDKLTEYFIKHAKYSPWEFQEDVLTDCPPKELIVRIVKARLLEHLSDEVPYVISPVLEYWEENDEGITQIVLVVDCPNERILRIVIGTKGGTVNTIASYAEKTIATLLRRPVNLQIRVTCSKKENTEKEKKKESVTMPRFTYPKNEDTEGERKKVSA